MRNRNDQQLMLIYPWWCSRAGYLSLGLVLLLGPPVLGQRVIYVNAKVAGGGDGTAWPDAYTDLQDALDDARVNDGCPCEIWVVAGRYTPDRGTGDRMARFHLVDGVAIYGGFAGSETDCEQRSWVANETILSGDLNGDDGPADCALFTDCCRDHDGLGCDDPECEARVCAVEPRCCDGDPPDPFASWAYFGCAQYALHECCNTGSRQSCENSIVVVEAVNTGPGTLLDGLVVKGSYVSFLEDVLPGGLLALGATISINNCTVGDNQDVGIFTWYGGSAVTLLNSTFENHLGAGVGGENTAFMVDGCAFLQNNVGLGSYSDSSGTVKNCVFRDNHVGLSFNGPLTVTNCEFSNNGGGAHLESDPGRADLVDCRFLDNGSALAFGGSIATVRNCTFIGNGSVRQYGVFTSSFSAVSVINTLFANNTPGFATFDLDISRVTLKNCTIAGERLPSAFGAILWAVDTSTHIVNSVFWDNQNIRGEGGQNVQFYLSDSTLDINYSIVPGWTGSLGGVGNSGVDPMFVDPDGADYFAWKVDEDLRLLPGSPAINAGDPNPVGIPSTDLDGHARVLCGRVDIGAYEFGIGDYNCDQTVDLSDFANWSACMTGPGAPSIPAGCEAFDFNADGAIDLLDFAALQPAILAP